MMIFILFILCGSLFLLWQSEEAPIILVDTAPLTTEAPGSEPSVIVTATPDVPPLATPTQVPDIAPSEAPTETPDTVPTVSPTEAPDTIPTEVPIEAPDVSPTMVPTEIPTQIPVAAPTEAPTELPVVTPAVTALTTYLKSPMTSNPYTSLSVPTQITKIGTDYFLVDCYHDLILTATSLDTPLNQWLVMSDQINRGHTIAGNGTVYLADDTENHRILVFIKEGNSYA